MIAERLTRLQAQGDGARIGRMEHRRRPDPIRGIELEEVPRTHATTVSLTAPRCVRAPALSLHSAAMPLAVDTLELGPIGTNTYIVRADAAASEAVVVDPSGDAASIRLRLASLGAECAAILVTHGHFDHVVSLADLAEGTGAPVYAPEGERALLEQPAPFTPAGLVVRPWAEATWLSGGETVSAAGVDYAVTSVPGHSPAHLAFFADGHLFSGDVLFAGSVGRTDLPGGSWQTLSGSIERLLDAYPPETAVHPGHGPSTTLGAELARNPFLADLRAAREAR